jgi:hypothetical protein
MQAIWIVMMTLVLALSGVLGLALVTRVTFRTRRPVRQRASINSTGAQCYSGHLPAALGGRPVGVVEGHSPRVW